MADPRRDRARSVNAAGRIAKWTALALGVLVIAVASVVTWMLSTTSGARWTVARALSVVGDKLAIGSTEGTIAGPLELRDLRYRDPAMGIDLRIARVGVDVVLIDLLRRTAHVRALTISGLNVALSEPTEPPPEESKPLSLKPPIDMVLDSLDLERARIERDDVSLLEITRAQFAGRWTDVDLAIQKLALDSPQGRVRLAGRLDNGRKRIGNAAGEFRWRFGERTMAGILKAHSEDKATTLTTNLSAPVDARLDLKLIAEETLPWSFTLDLPHFDPRTDLLPDTRVSSLALALIGEGTLDRGKVSGEISVDDGVLHVDPLSFVRHEEDVEIEGVLRPGEKGAAIRLAGTVRTAEEPLAAKADAKWHDVVIPAFWTGQDLYTGGQMHIDGSVEDYAATGRLSLGPKDRIATIELDVQGSSDRVALKQFDIVQQPGRLAMTGELGLKPVLSWNVKAQATQFDPGAFAAAWSGRLNFGLMSDGQLSEAGPRGRFVLDELNGRLRGRGISGEGDLVLTPQRVVAGTLSLHSGQSDVEFRGKPGDAMDGRLDLNVRTLNDWLPNSSGELRAGFAIRGRWPDLSIQGDARGSGLDVSTLRADAITLNVDLRRPTDPAGSAGADIRGLSVRGFNFSRLVATASGAADDHKLSLDANGDRLSAQVSLQGAQKEGGWAGSIDRLVFDVREAARLVLRDPVTINYAAHEFDMSRACLADGDIELCARADMNANGAMSADYSIKGLPLALANVFAPEDLPLSISGMLEGEGNVQKTAQGEWRGTVELRSPTGRVERRLEGEEDASETLLSYARFKAGATLSGRDARASVGASVMDGGSLRGEVSLKGLGETSTSLNGSAAVKLPGLAPVAVLAPQLANLRGQAEANVELRGTLQQPDVRGRLNAADLALDIPAIGLELEDGRVEATPNDDGSFALKGGIKSGEGRVTFDGRATMAGELDMNLEGDRFVAADMAGAKVIVTPDLHFLRAEGRMSLNGEVRVPKAAINLQKLPRGERAPKPSSDVIVVDERSSEEAASAIPLDADVTVILGDEVELTGFGLQAKVDGRLQVIETPGQPTLGSGQIRLQGQYKAYGQDLTIEQGQLLYASSPLDNPGLNIRATRVIDDVTAGLRIAGTVQTPELTIFSDPAMSQANALSYLVAGKPLDEVGSGDGEGDALQSAARSLGTAGGGLLAKSIGRRLGVDEFAIKDEEMIGGSALTVGEYLSPRLYVSYGVGLFEPGEVVTLRYKLKKDFSIQAQTGPEDTRAGVEYRIER